MPKETPLQPSHFYDRLPTSDHRPGDIWTGLPSFGALPDTHLRGLIITPACDLANRKCETVTYLPLMTVARFIGSSAVRFECWSEIRSTVQKFEGHEAVTEPDRFELPATDELQVLLDTNEASRGKTLSVDDKVKLQGFITYVHEARAGNATLAHVLKFFKRERLQATISRLITNSWKADIHFLPSVGGHKQYGPVEDHSLALFRHPTSIPIRILDWAQHCSAGEWEHLRDQRTAEAPSLSHMSAWPIKVATLRSEFFGDLISRYLSMFVRLGSSDFNESAIEVLADDIQRVQS